MMQLDTQGPTPRPWYAAPTQPAAPTVTLPAAPPETVALPPPSIPPTPARGHGGGRRVAELGLVALLSAGLASSTTYAVTRTSAPAPPTAGSTQPAVADRPAPVVQGNATAPDWAATAKAVAPSVVAISVSGTQGQGEGSGVVIDSTGHILTNNHVVTGGGSGATIRVTLSDGRTYAARIVGTDPPTDLAVLALTTPPRDLTPISVGDSDKLAVGDPVMAVGNPLGLAGTVTTGIVSALDRPVSTGGGSQSRSTTSETVVTNAIQTSAAINPGNSGGALVTASGQLVGINSSIASLGSGSGGQSGNIGIGFAIPINEARTIAEQLIATGAAQHAYLGVSSADGTVTDAGAQRAAAVVKAVSPGTPAATAGLRAGDVIVALDGKRIESSLSLVASIREQRVGDTVTLTVVRDGARQELGLTLGARPTAAG